MPEMDDVISGEVIEADWGNDIRDRTLQRYASATARDTANPSPDQGELAYLEDLDLVQVYVGTRWDPLFSPNVNCLYPGRSSSPSSKVGLVGPIMALQEPSNYALLASNFYHTGSAWASDEYGSNDDAAGIKVSHVEHGIEFLIEENYDPTAGLPATFAELNVSSYDSENSGRQLRVVYWGSSEPSSGMVEGDLWAKYYGDDRGMYAYDGSDWVPLFPDVVNLDYASQLEISSGVLTPTHTYCRIDTEGQAATDDLIQITGTHGDLLILRTYSSTRDVTIKHNTSYITLAGSADFTLASNRYAIGLLCIGTNLWTELFRTVA